MTAPADGTDAAEDAATPDAPSDGFVVPPGFPLPPGISPAAFVQAPSEAPFGAPSEAPFGAPSEAPFGAPAGAVRPSRVARPRRRGWATALILVAVVLGGAWVFGKLGGGGAQPGGLVEVPIDDVVGDRKVAILKLDGVLLEGAPDLLGLQPDPVKRVRDALAKAKRDPRIAALILSIDSPGGGVTASDVLYAELVRFKREMADLGQPVVLVVLMRDVAASGAYYLACAADRIVAHPTTLTGSIGVVSQGFNFAGAMEKLGIADATLTSGRAKDAGSPFRRPRPFEREQMRQVLAGMQRRFEAVVYEGRNRALANQNKALSTAEIAALADGSIYTASEALAAKLIDAIGYERDAIALAQSLAGLAGQPVSVVRYQSPPFSLSLPFGLQAGAESPAASVPGAPAASAAALVPRLGLKELLSRAGPRIWAIWLGQHD